MKRLARYIDDHAWTHWAVAALYWGAILGIYELLGRVIAR